MQEALPIILLLLVPKIMAQLGDEYAVDGYMWSSCRSETVNVVTVRNISVANYTGNSQSSYLSPYGDYMTIAIVNSSISTVPPSFFKEYSRMVDLYLTNVDISEMIPGAFSGPSNLQCLDISVNNINRIQDGLFNGLHYLKSLNLSHNNIDSISEHAFKGLTNLNILDLQNNNIFFLDNKLFSSQTNSLRVLNISFNNLKEINDTFKNMSLQNLDLDYNEIGKINFETVSAISIHLRGNKIRNLNRVKRTTELVDLSQNMIETIDSNTFVNSSLKEIYLSNNHISYIRKDSLFGVVNLTHLHLDFNNLTTLPNTCFKDLKQLKYLNVSHNSISKLQYGVFDHLKNLKYLDISYNKFEDLKEDILSHLTRLVEFYFSNNEIRNIDTLKLLKYCPSLHEVNIDGNFWTCKQLAEMIKTFELNGKIVIKGSYFDSDNVRGISCDGNDFHSPINSHQDNNSYNIDDFNKLIAAINLRTAAANKFFNEDFTKTLMYNYFNGGFKNSNLFKYLESLKSPQFIVAKTEYVNESNVQKLVSALDVEKNNVEDNGVYVILIMNLTALIILIILVAYFITRYNKKVLNNENLELI